MAKESGEEDHTDDRHGLRSFLRSPTGLAAIFGLLGAVIGASPAIILLILGRISVEPPRPPCTVAPASELVVVLFPTADTTANSGAPNLNFGRESQLLSNGKPEAVSYLRFDFPAPPRGRELAGATLMVWTAQLIDGKDLAGSDSTYFLHRASNAWGESQMTWEDKPPVGNRTIGEFRATDMDMKYEVELDVPSLKRLLCTTSTLAITTKPEVSDDLWLQSNNTQTVERRPQLILDFS